MTIQTHDKGDVPLEKQYEYLTTQLRYLDDKIFRSFALFIKLATAVIGGTFYLYLKFPDLRGWTLLMFATNAAFVGIGLGNILLISNNLRSWQEHRKTLTVRYKGIPPLEGVGWGLSEVVTCVGIALSVVGFLLINPLGRPYPCFWVCGASIVSLLVSAFVGAAPFFLPRGRALWMSDTPN